MIMVSLIFFHIPLFLFRKTHLVEKKTTNPFSSEPPPIFGWGFEKKKILTPPYPPPSTTIHHHLPPAISTATQATHLRHFRRRSARYRRGWGIRAPAPPRVAAFVALEWHLGTVGWWLKAGPKAPTGPTRFRKSPESNTTFTEVVKGSG